MKLRAMRSFRHGTMTFGRGAAVDVTEPVARDLIKRGLVAEEGAEPPKQMERPTQVDRTKHKPASAGNQRRDDKSATTGRAADRKED
ncbi:hypothetical protein [Tardiphaga sp. OK246]|uniref:hypothetical protein n=1 Tax=Tardiphaga sp. OK246 TaxID=1855307 RepID=UPI0011323E35|nr:hypothetical protein [Tardiphaga sp. OK246]